MSKNKVAMAVDIDGVLADFEMEFCQSFGYENREMDNLEQRYPKFADIITEFVQNPDTYSDLLPIFGGVLLVRQAIARGFRVALLTARPKTAFAVTRKWLKEYEVPYDDLIFCPDKYAGIEYYNGIHENDPSCSIRVLVDDLIQNVKELPEGVKGLLWEQPWNSNSTLIQKLPLVRYNNEKMRLETKLDTVSDWIDLWRLK